MQTGAEKTGSRRLKFILPYPLQVYQEKTVKHGASFPKVAKGVF